LTAFSFGRNWLDYSRHLDEARVREAEQSLERLVPAEALRGGAFFDVGCGTGLFSIAALRLGAGRVLAIDLDEDAVAAARGNVGRFVGPSARALVEIRRGDILRPETAWQEGFEVVYAWGSLHHTGAMWQAVENALGCCRRGGRVVLALYNQTPWSPVWLRVKRAYHAAPGPVRLGMVATLSMTRAAVRIARARHPFRLSRGMSVWYDAVDWLGGLPYEYASPDRVTAFAEARGFRPVRVTGTRRSGCNEFVLERAE
jgi:2-polyprenyl-6-hydroxyphenyl methylase/3-demethylubiquinone-9 3-methyltransferase